MAQSMLAFVVLALVLLDTIKQEVVMVLTTRNAHSVKPVVAEPLSHNHAPHHQTEFVDHVPLVITVTELIAAHEKIYVLLDTTVHLVHQLKLYAPMVIIAPVKVCQRPLHALLEITAELQEA